MKGKQIPDFTRMSKTDIAKAKKVALNTVYGWIRRGCAVNGDGTLDLQVVDEFLASRDREATAPGSLEAERARLAKEQADKCAMENAVARGELVHVEDSAMVLEAIIMAIRAKLLGMGAKVSPQVVSCNSIAEVRSLIDAAAADILVEVATIDVGGIVRSIECPSEAPPAGASASPPDRKRMGRRASKVVVGKQRGARAVDHGEGGVSAGNS